MYTKEKHPEKEQFRYQQRIFLMLSKVELSPDTDAEEYRKYQQLWADNQRALSLLKQSKWYRRERRKDGVLAAIAVISICTILFALIYAALL